MAMPDEPEREVDYEAILRKPIWTVDDIVDYFSLESEQVVYKWNQTGWGGSEFAPKRFLVGKRRRYKRDEVLFWFESRQEDDLCTPSSRGSTSSSSLL